jgi:hypothetical protein
MMQKIFIFGIASIIVILVLVGACSSQSSTLSDSELASIKANMDIFNGGSFNILCPKDWDKSTRLLSKSGTDGQVSCSIQINPASLQRVDPNNKIIIWDIQTAANKDLQAFKNSFGQNIPNDIGLKKIVINGNTGYRTDYFLESKTGKYISIVDISKEKSLNFYGLYAIYSDPKDKNTLEVMINSFEIEK